MAKLETLTGWAVVIRRKSDGSEFLAAGNGDNTPVWTKRNRKYAVAYKKELRAHGLKARVIAVAYATPRAL